MTGKQEGDVRRGINRNERAVIGLGMGVVRMHYSRYKIVKEYI